MGTFRKSSGRKGTPFHPNHQKVKGHATDDMVNRGEVQQVDKDGNDEADEIAKDAIQLHGLDFVKCMRVLSRRQAEYNAFVFAIVSHIVERYAIHRALLDCLRPFGNRITSKVKTEIRYVHYAPMHRADLTDNRLPTLDQAQAELDPFWFRTLAKYGTAARSVWDFVHRTPLALSTLPRAITTWLELYIWYRLNGGARPQADRPSKARTRVTLAGQINSFVRIVRATVSRSTLGSSLRTLYRPAPSGGDPLQGVALRGNAPAIASVLCITPCPKDPDRCVPDNFGTKETTARSKGLLGGKTGTAPNDVHAQGTRSLGHQTWETPRRQT